MSSPQLSSKPSSTLKLRRITLYSGFVLMAAMAGLYLLQSSGEEEHAVELVHQELKVNTVSTSEASSQEMLEAKLAFHIDAKAENPQIGWSIYPEFEAKEAIIERSSDGKSFTKVARVDVSRRQFKPRNYKISDFHFLPEQNKELFYRLTNIGEEGDTLQQVVRQISLE
ncbi:MAG: hypothetical protein AAFY71_01500 [Bacteroidota bacterium]